MQLSAARGEYESFQIIVRAPAATRLANVNLTVPDLTNASGAVISQGNFALFREQYVLVGPSSPNWGGPNQPLAPGWYPDGLIPFLDPETGRAPLQAALVAVPCSVAAGTNQPFWVDIFVPRDAVAGIYTGIFTVTTAGGNVSGQINLQVWNFTLPLQPALKSAFIFSQGVTLAAARELLRNRVAPLNVNPEDETALIGGYGLQTANLGLFSGANVSNCTMSAPPPVSDIRNIAARHARGLLLLDYVADEIGTCPGLFPHIRQWARALHQAGILSLVTMAPEKSLFDDGFGGGRSAVDIWVVLPQMYDNASGQIALALAKGDQLWSYNTLVQDPYSPKWEIDFAPVNFRIQPGFISQSLRLSGLLYWRVDQWQLDAWSNVNTTGLFNSNNYPGEGLVVYPGGKVGIQGVAPSMRLKWIRDGVEDYEYVNLLKQAGYGDWALQISRSIAPDWTNWTRDPSKLESARTALGQKLDSISQQAHAGKRRISPARVAKVR